MTRWALPALGVLAALLAALVVGEFTGREATDPATPPVAAPAAIAATAAGLAAPSDEQVAQLLARPLFSLDRRPQVEAPEAATAAAAAAPMPRLAGIMVAGSTRQAIFAPETAGKAIVVGEGDTVGIFKVKTIGASEVVLEDDGAAVHAVQPHYASAGPAAATPAPFESSATPVPGLSGLEAFQAAHPPTPGFARPAIGAAR